MAKPATEMSLSELERVFTQRRAELAGLVRRRDKLKADMEAIDAQIHSLNGGEKGLKLGRPVTRRPRNGQSLRKTVLQLLTENPDGFKLADLQEKVIASGHQSTSENFKNVLYQTIHACTDVIRDPETSCYKLKAADPKKAKKPKAE